MADLAAITAFINPEAPHSHRCGQCGEVWTHCSADLAHCSDHEFDAAHHCPVCHSGPYRTKLLNAEVL
jgi:formate dehydrogenase maturation protein FdhE